MRRIFIATVVGSCLFASASSGSTPQYSWGWPLVNFSVGCLYFDPNYPYSQDRQHLGIDLPGTTAGTRVNSPVAGRVITNRSSNSIIVDEAYIVIRESATGYEHVLGHIRSTLSEGRTVARGDQVGTVANWGSRSHVHWGVNRASVSGATGISTKRGWGSGNWGWGRAPRGATQTEASNRGWFDINGQIVPRGHYCSRT
jgi:Peptidase family M23